MADGEASAVENFAVAEAERPSSVGGGRRGRRRDGAGGGGRLAAERGRRLIESIQMQLNGERLPERPPEADVHSVAESLPDDVDELVAKIAAMHADTQSSAREMRRLLSARNLERLSDDEWGKVASQLADSALNGESAHFAVDNAVKMSGFKAFQCAFGERVSSAMSSYVLCPQVAHASLPEFVALLLVALWPRPHSRSNLESNEILYNVISSLKGWIITITDELEDDVEMMSRCALGLGEVCRHGQRSLWIKWPELVDEIYVSIHTVLTSNSRISKEAKSVLLEALLQMHNWTNRKARCTASACTQTPSSFGSS